MSYLSKPLEQVATLQRGFDLPVQAREPGGVPVFAANGVVGTHSVEKCEGPGVITGRSGSIGRVHFSAGSYWPLNTSLFVKDFHGNEPRYVYWLLRSIRLERYHEGTGVPTLNRNVVHKIPVPCPPLPEQRRIAAILDKADALRAKRREAIAKLDQLLQSVFLDMFGDPVINPKRWAVTNVDNIGDVQGGLQLSVKRSSLPLQVPYLRVANVYRERIDLSEIKRFGVTAAERERTTLVKDDILIVEGHGNPEEIGRCAIWDGIIDGCSHQNHLIRLRINGELATPVFVSHFLNSRGGRMGLTSASNTTSGLNTISVSKVRACPVFLPPLDLQQQFAKIVGSVRQRRSDLQVQEVRLQALFASLQHRAFCGTL